MGTDTVIAAKYSRTLLAPSSFLATTDTDWAGITTSSLTTLTVMTLVP
jgi:hypothetical protein